MSNCRRFIPALAVALAGMFFGIAAYISLAEQPARLALAAGPMLAQWKISFASGIAIQGALAIITGVVALIAWWLYRDWRWMAGGLLMLLNWPWTLVMIAPLNNALNATTAEAAGPASMAMIAQWGQVHTARAFFGLCALSILLWALGRAAAQSAR